MTLIALTAACAGDRLAASRVTHEIAVSESPSGLVLDAAEARLFVTHYGGLLSTIDLTSGSVVRTLSLPGDAGAIEYDRDEKRLYVALEDGTTAGWEGDDIAVIDPQTGVHLGDIRVGESPTGMHLDTSTGTLYVANYDGTISIADTGSRVVTKTINLGTMGAGPVDVTSRGERLYAADQHGDIHVIDSRTYDVLAVITVTQGGSLTSLYSDPAFGAIIAVTDEGGDSAGHVYSIDVDTNEILDWVEVDAYPSDIAVDMLARTAYVVNRESNSVSLIDLTDWQVTGSVAVGELPQNLVLEPESGNVYVTNLKPGSISVLG